LKAIVVSLVASLAIAPGGAPRVNRPARPRIGPSVENALLAEHELARTLQANDADGFGRLLDDDWSVVSAKGGLGDHFRDGFVAAIKSGQLTRKTVTLSDSRIRLEGDVAIVTSQVATSGMFEGKPFDVQERQTDVLVWRDGGWKCVLTHESYVHPSVDATGPTTESALSADHELTRALEANDARAVGRLLADDWFIAPIEGGKMVDRAAFLAAIASGDVARKSVVPSEPRVRLYGNVAVVTSRVTTSGTAAGNWFDTKEQQTNVWKWDGRAWKAILTHATKIVP
jgi:ketosteroid isomerase-like protein